MNHEVRTFTVSPSVIQHLIKSQAGTLAKAIAELVMNSIDAGATSVDIRMDNKTMTVTDNGHGFRTREEILSCFEVFGFDHSAHDRINGRFGLGRGQCWNWLRTLWRSHGFALDVDIRNRGLDYTLRADLPHQPGLVIEGDFYTPLSNVELYDAERELSHLVKYVQVPVTFNGKAISEDPEKGKWTLRNEDGFLRVTEGYRLDVYSQGMFIQSLSASQVGVAGTLVTRTGAPLQVNIARNMVLVNECDRWKRLQKQLKELAGKRTSSPTTRMDGPARDYLAAQTTDPANVENFAKPIFTLSTGKHVDLNWISTRLRAETPITAAESGDRMAEALLRDNSAIPLAHVTLERFGATSAQELLAVLLVRLQDAEGWAASGWRDALTWGINKKLAKDSIKDCPGFRQLEASVIPDKDLSPALRNFLRAVDENLNGWGAGVRQNDVAKRVLKIGRSAAAEAYTDGRTYIAIVDETAEEAIKAGVGGFLRIAALLVHEYAHDSDDAGSHIHDLDFMTAVHDRLIDQAPDLTNAAIRAFKDFTKANGKISRKNAYNLDTLEKFGATATA